MSRTSAFTLDHQWDPYKILDIQRDRRCVGWAYSKQRKCYNVVNWADMDTFYGLLTDLSSQPMDATLLQPRLQQLASVGLCKQVHRRAQIGETTEKWTRKIEAAVQRLGLQAGTQYNSSNTRSTTASFASTGTFRTPPTHRTRSSDSIVSGSSSSTAQSEIESTLRCIEAIHEQQRILLLRLASLQTLDTPRLDPIRQPARVSTASVPSLHLSDNNSSHHTVRSHTTTTSRRSTLTSSTLSPSSFSSSSSDSSSPPDRRSLPHTPSDSPCPVQPGTRQYNRTSPLSHTPQDSHPTAVSVSTPSNISHGAPLQEARSLHIDNPIITLASHDERTPSSPVLPSPVSIIPATASPSQATTTTATQSTQAPTSTPSTLASPHCTMTHVRRLPITDECPICYEGGPLSTLPARDLVWCTSSCGRTVHKSCFDAWAAQNEDTMRDLSCPVCRYDWAQGCGCGGRSQCGVVHAERKEIETECPICKEGMSSGLERVEWCKDQCGQSVHSECMRIWAAHCRDSERLPTCVMCRAEWTEDCGC